MRKLHPDNIRNIIFGLEDGFVSTAGVLFGVATATHEKYFILVAGIITVLVEATSMGAGAYISEKSSANSTKKNKARALYDGILMFFAYVLAGGIILIPYALFNQPVSQFLSVALTMLGLYAIGYWSKKSWKNGLEMLLIGGLAISIGYIAGQFLQKLKT